MTDSFGARQSISVGDAEYEIFRLDAIGDSRVEQLPYTLKILLENLLRHEDGEDITAEDIEALAAWDPKADPETEIAFTPARVILQDFTGVPAIVDLAAMRDAMVKLGGKASAINPLSPAELVIDHSVQVDHFGTADSLAANNAIEFERNKERYSFLRWGQEAFRNFRVVPELEPVSGGDLSMSWFAMPGWQAPGYLRQPLLPRGTLEQVVLPSQALGRELRLAVYRPPGYDAGTERVPVAYIFGGRGALDQGGFPEALDNLIGGAARPLLAIFILEDGFGSLSSFADMFAGELVPFIDSRYRTQ